MSGLTNAEWERRLGGEIRALRLRLHLTQAQLATRANLDRTTVARIERGEGGSVGSLVQIARALGREDWLNAFAPPEPTVSPMELLRAQRAQQPRPRRRARRAPAAP